ncbi:hypothetical protein F511_24002 [Dorcoceras hygrometricum]|uniref:Uncharacterized protein n=1 Tax=Dorcoceras hygrometricum TaxID=472368 RepID=A0A2Z7DC08_9LAMI|nr:hypothetical protein F511_24002 [Dorcoceras hygrometricum]
MPNLIYVKRHRIASTQPHTPGVDFGESWQQQVTVARAGVVPEKSNAIVGVVTTGFECLTPSCDGLTGPDDHGPMISRLIDRGALGNQAGQSGSSAGRCPHP